MTAHQVLGILTLFCVIYLVIYMYISHKRLDKLKKEHENKLKSPLYLLMKSQLILRKMNYPLLSGAVVKVMTDYQTEREKRKLDRQIGANGVPFDLVLSEPWAGKYTGGLDPIDGEIHIVFKDTENICMCECHQDDHKVMHFKHCCHQTYTKYITSDGVLDMNRYKKLK